MQVIPITIEKDLERVKEIATQAFATTPDASLDQWFSFSEMEKAIKEDRGLCLKSVNDEGSVIGILYAQEENPINGKEGREKWVIVISAVDPKMTGKGIGSALLKEMERQLSTNGVMKLFVYTNKDDEQVINFYRKNGYEAAGYVREYQYGKGNSAVFLLKYLSQA